MTTTHDLKSWPDFFAPVLDRTKTFEVRNNDRLFCVGDILHLREWNDRDGTYTGRSIKKRVTYILQGGGAGFIAPRAGVHRHFVVMSLTDVEGNP
jgi:Domain of unknown function (DUF3850)